MSGSISAGCEILVDHRALALPRGAIDISWADAGSIIISS